MSFKFLQNVIPASFVDTFLQWKNFMKDPSNGPGWVVYSSDGQSGTSNFSIDNVSTSGSGSSGLNNSLAWFVLKPQSPLTRSFCFQRSQNDPKQWRVKYSFGGFNMSTATYNKTPSPNTNEDEILLLGGGTDASPTFSDIFSEFYEKKYVFHACADNSSSSFYFFAYPVSKLSYDNSSVKLMMIHDSLLDGYASEDTDASVAGLFKGPTINIRNINKCFDENYAFCFFGSVKKYDVSGDSYSKFSVASYGDLFDQKKSFTMSKNQVFNPHTLKQEAFPCMYFSKRKTDGNPYDCFKGNSKYIYVGSGNMTNGHLLTLNNERDMVFINGFLFPWNGSYLLA